MLVDKRREVLRLYREILRTTRQFQWTNENGEQWSTILQKNARMELEQNRHEQNSETISKMIIFGWKAVEEVQQKMAAKHAEIQKGRGQQQAPPSSSGKP